MGCDYTVSAESNFFCPLCDTPGETNQRLMFLIGVLQDMADEDYRGYRSTASIKAWHALCKMKVEDHERQTGRDRRAIARHRNEKDLAERRAARAAKKPQEAISGDSGHADVVGPPDDGWGSGGEW
jgi:hypothetical protein